MYDYIIVTHIPAFYKVNLYNELAKKLKLLIVFIASNTAEKRADDFITLENADFEYRVLYDGDFQDRDVVSNIKTLKNILREISYKKILVSGWDLKEFWYIVFTNKKAKNCLALESTINESRVDGVIGVIKKIFLSRISSVFASGKLHVELLKVLKYEGAIKITKGVGIINKPYFTPIKREYTKKFLFIGRLSTEKNIQFIVELFNTMPSYTLTIIGAGPQKNELQSIAKENIAFIGPVDNSKLKEYFLSNDVFILLSISEPWGLVVEEALYYGMPVIVTNNCGVSELIESGINGYVLNVKNLDRIKNTILGIDDRKYQKFLRYVDKYSIYEKDKVQVDTYL